MLNATDNEYLTQVGPGTPMGSFLREYWMPAMLSSELPEPDSDPVRVMLLGEELIAFRDSEGRVGLIQNLCPHRGASLFYGRNEHGGLRCLYHGWKFDVTGACVHLPSEPPNSNFKDKVRATAYPTVERAGIVWAYLGSREEPPSLPGIEATLVEPERINVQVQLRECNWLQALEGDIDTIHTGILHWGAAEPSDYPEGTFNYYEVLERHAHFVAVDTDYGCMYGAARGAGEGRVYWRIGEFMFPIFTQPPPGLLGHKILTTCWVPMDDTHTLMFLISVPDHGAYVPGSPRPNQTGGPMANNLPNTTDWFGRFVPVHNTSNDFGMDRAAQRRMRSFSGLGDGVAEDHAVQASMHPVLDRTGEHLGTSDMMIIQVRRRLLQAAEAWNEHKAAPPALDSPELYGVRSGGIYLDEGADWLEGIAPYLPAFVEHAELDIAVVGGRKVRSHERDGSVPWS